MRLPNVQIVIDQWCFGPPNAAREQDLSFGVVQGFQNAALRATRRSALSVRAAGFEALLYPSQQGGTLCLAVYPENLGSGGTRIEVVGGVPPEARYFLMDKDNRCLAS